MGESVREARSWVYGFKYIVCDRPFSTVISHLATGLQVKCNWPVASITYGANSSVFANPTAPIYTAPSAALAAPSGVITVTSKHGEQLQAKRVVITVPLPVLQAGDIHFDPPLPAPKQRAIGAVRMGCAVKVLMAFSHRVWPAHLFDIVCTDSFLPEFLAVGFAAGDAAEAMASLPPQVVLSRALEQLDAMFRRPCSTCKPGPDSVRVTETCPEQTCGNDTSGSCCGCKEHRLQLQALPNAASDDSVGTFVVPAALIKPPSCSRSSMGSSFPAAATSPLCTSCRPASACFVSGCFADWSKDIYIRGAYTHPTIGAGDARDQLAVPVAGKLFFAGEATHFGVNPCMQGALDTGTRVANEVFWSLQESRL
ncbi:unnamed protein product [Closterium sp. Yama58-4]|nr:unnamed protein product [Closterium sp. Yama58-4]